MLAKGSQLRVIHRNLKASNILLDKDMKAKIADLAWQGYLQWIKLKVLQVEL